MLLDHNNEHVFHKRRVISRPNERILVPEGLGSMGTTNITYVLIYGTFKYLFNKLSIINTNYNKASIFTLLKGPP